MDILKMLQQPLDTLYPEDLEFFEAELATGVGYSDSYKVRCRKLIKLLRKQMDKCYDEEFRREYAEYSAQYGLSDELSPTNVEYWMDTDGTSAHLNIPLMSVTSSSAVPEEVRAEVIHLSPREILERDLSEIRNQPDYMSAFEAYVETSGELTPEYVDKNISSFDEDELNTIIQKKQMGEAFLEKYFAALDPDKIARYQLFSESFFMKHYPDLKPGTVLKFGKNEWRKKSVMSKQLEVFLKLKGVRL